jgi:glycosyltransferase involved in cell wall biosynthesis
LVGAREGVPYLDFVKTLIRRHRLEEQVILVPETDQVWAYLRASDIFVCCSYVEAHSLAILESQAFGLPLVSTPCVGLDEQVIWNRSALKFNLGDIEQLARQLNKLLDQPKLRQELGRQALAHFDLHTDDQGMVANYCDVILQAQNRRAGAVSQVA